MRIRIIFLVIVCVVFVSGCGFGKREQAITERTKQLDEREQQLQAWEQQLKLKEAELLTREQLLDSTTRQLEVGVYDSTLVGKWLVKMKCIETTCPGSAIGDTKTEHWQISYEEDKLVVHTISANKLSRVYSGFFKGGNLELQVEAGKETGANITVSLRRKDEQRLEGMREVIQPEGCKILYALEVEKQ